MLVCLDGKSHEIDPIQYKSVSPESLISVSRLNRHVHVLWASAILIPVIATVMDSGLSTTWINSTRLLLSAVLINIYLVAIDMLARLTLCKYKVNLKRLVEELTDDTSNEYTLDAMLSIILHEDTVLVKEVGASTRNLGTVKIEEEEVTRNEDATGKMARVLVDGRGIIGGLESDILRALTLESLGGNAGNAAQATVNIMSSERHMKAIGDWVAADAKLLVAQREPLAIAIVRALCAYAGGIGVCLQQEISLRPVQSWEIPPLARDGPAPSTRPATFLPHVDIATRGNPKRGVRHCGCHTFCGALHHALQQRCTGLAQRPSVHDGPRRPLRRIRAPKGTERLPRHD